MECDDSPLPRPVQIRSATISTGLCGFAGTYSARRWPHRSVRWCATSRVVCSAGGPGGTHGAGSEAPFPRNRRPSARSLRARRMRPLARVNRFPTFDPPRRTPPFARTGGATARGVRNRVSCRLLPANSRAERERKMPFARQSMPRWHRAPGSATRSRHAFPGCERHTCLDAGKSVLAIAPSCARSRSRADCGASSRRPDATHRRCPACIGGGANRATHCGNRPRAADRPGGVVRR